MPRQTKPTKSKPRKKKAAIEYLNPPALHHNPAFTQAIAVSGPVKTVYVGGQNAVDVSGEVVGKGSLKEQTEQILTNVQAALEAGGAQLDHVIRWNVYVVQGQPLQEGFEVFQRIWGERGQPPSISVLMVAGLAHPDFLAEVDAIAVVPE